MTEHLGAARFNRPPRPAKRHGFSPPLTGLIGDVSPLAHEKNPGSKLFRHRGLSGVTSTLLKLELRQLENGDCLGEKECRV